MHIGPVCSCTLTLSVCFTATLEARHVSAPVPCMAGMARPAQGYFDFGIAVSPAAMITGHTCPVLFDHLTQTLGTFHSLYCISMTFLQCGVSTKILC